MICHYCSMYFTEKHGNERYCSNPCRKQAEKVYARHYQRRRRGAMKTVYQLSTTGNRVFFVLPFRYANILALSWVKWFTTIREDSESLLVMIGNTGDTPICYTSGQYRVYLEHELCEKFNLLTTARHWGITYSVQGQIIVACIERRNESQKNSDGRKNYHS